MMKALYSIDNQGADTTSASGSISLQSTNQLERNEQRHYSPAAGADLTELYDWEHDWADDEDDDGYNCDKRPERSSSSSHPALRYFYPYSTSAVLGSGRDDWIIPPLLAFMAQIVSLVFFSSNSSYSPSLEGSSSTTAATTYNTQQPLFCSMVCFNALVVVVTAWLYYENRKQQRQQRQQDNGNNIVHHHHHQHVHLCIPEILMSFTNLLSWLDFGKMACSTLILCALGLSLLVLQALLNQLVGFTSPLPAAALEAIKRKQQAISTTRRRIRVPRVIQFENDVKLPIQK